MTAQNSDPTGVSARVGRSYDDSRLLDEAVNHERHTGLVALTAREIEVLQLISFGATNAEAAQQLQLSVHAIKFHLASIYSRLGVSNRTEAAVAFLRLTASSSGSKSKDE